MRETKKPTLSKKRRRNGLFAADLAQALANVNQSYSYSGVRGHHVFNGGGQFVDNTDFCDVASLTVFQSAKCVVICATPAAPVGTDGTSTQ